MKNFDVAVEWSLWIFDVISITTVIVVARNVSCERGGNFIIFVLQCFLVPLSTTHGLVYWKLLVILLLFHVAIFRKDKVTGMLEVALGW